MKALPPTLPLLFVVLASTGHSLAADLSDLAWFNSGTEVTITDCDIGATGALVIPDTIDGNPVVAIGPSAFSSCSSLSSVALPNTVTSIGNLAFYFCPSLTSLTLGNSVETIGTRAFFGCAGLSALTIPATVTSIGQGSFVGCDSLTAISVGGGSTSFASVGGVLFSSDLTELVAYPNGLAGSYAIPPGVTTVPKESFTRSDLLTSVTIPASLTSIASGSFNDCDSLMDFQVDGANPTYQDIDGILCDTTGTLLHTFPSGRPGPVEVPDGLATIGSSAFSWCSSVTAIALPPSVTNIQDRAFEYCRDLKLVKMTDAVTYIGFGAFYSCRELVRAELSKSIASLPNYAFYDCQGLTRISIPAGVTDIGYASFFNNESLSCIVFAGPPPTLDAGGVFSFLPVGATAMVVPSQVAAYGGVGATWDAFTVAQLRSVKVVGSGYTPTGFFIDVADGTAGLKVTTSPSATVPFTDQAGVVETLDGGGQPNRFFIPGASLPGGTVLFRVEIDC